MTAHHLRGIAKESAERVSNSPQVYQILIVSRHQSRTHLCVTISRFLLRVF